MVLNAEKDFLDKLNKIQDDNPKDLERYKFVLTEAIDTTSDSREMNLEDSNKRAGELADTDAKEKKERDAMMPSNEVKDRKKDADAQEPGRAKEEDSVAVPTWRETGQPATIAYIGVVGHHHHHHTATGWILRASLFVTLAFTGFEVWRAFKPAAWRCSPTPAITSPMP